MKFASVSDKGGRLNNEDSIKEVHVGSTYCFIVADGLGGEPCGEVASEIAAAAAADEFAKAPVVAKNTILSCLEAAQRAIEKKRTTDKKCSDMATTAAILITDGSKAVWGHVGDSRIYRFGFGKVKEISEDHSVSFEKFRAGIIEFADIRKSPEKNMLVKTLGDRVNFVPDISEVKRISPETAFLLCSDGFWEFVTEEEMEEALVKSSSAKEWLEMMIGRLDENKTEANDNFSAYAIKMQFADIF